MKPNSSTVPFRFQDQQKNNSNNAAPKTTNLPSNTSTSWSRHDQQSQALHQALEERRRLRAMEDSAPDPINQTARHRGRLVEHRIDQLRQELAEKNNSDK